MKIICLNAWGGRVHGPLLEYLADAQPDILCLQEVIQCDAPKAELIYRDEERELPQRTDLHGEIARALGDHHAILAPASTGPLWDGAVAYPSQWGVATYIRRGLPLIGQVQGFVHRDYLHDGFGAHLRPRTGLGVRVYDPSTDRRICVTQMHGIRDARGKMDTPERSVQGARFLAMADQLAQPGDVSVLCGDFNLLPESTTFTALADAGYTELVGHFAFPSTRSPLYDKPLPWADYMLINELGAVKAFDVTYDPVVSDHCPLELTI